MGCMDKQGITARLQDNEAALIATLIYSFVRIGAAVKMKAEDRLPKGATWELRLQEKSGRQHTRVRAPRSTMTGRKRG